MTAFLIISGSVLWLACGVLGGLCFYNYLQAEYPGIARAYESQHFVQSFIPCIAGPFVWLPLLVLGHVRHGLKLRHRLFIHYVSACRPKLTCFLLDHGADIHFEQDRALKTCALEIQEAHDKYANLEPTRNRPTGFNEKWIQLANLLVSYGADINCMKGTKHGELLYPLLKKKTLKEGAMSVLSSPA